MISWWAAYAAALQATPLPARTLTLSKALGSLLAEPLVALATAPSVDVSAMDGYAVCGNPPWRLLGQTLAGGPVPGALAAGHAWEVATGAPVPAEAIGVLPYEEATLAGDDVHGNPDLARHVRRRGEQCNAGDVLLPGGTPVSPLVLGLAAQAGLDHLLVQARPRVEVLVSGDEVTDSGIPAAGQTRDAIGPMLPGLISSFGGECLALSRISDTPAAMRTALSHPGADLLVVTGASSQGPADHLRPALVAAGALLLVDGVHCRPGHPMLLARMTDGRHVIGLPGNPLAALAAALTLLQPLLSALRADAPPAVTSACAMENLRGHPADVTLLPVNGDSRGVSPAKHVGAAQLQGVALANYLAVVPPGGVEGNDQVDVLPLPGGNADRL